MLQRLILFLWSCVAKTTDKKVAYQNIRTKKSLISKSLVERHRLLAPLLSGFFLLVLSSCGGEASRRLGEVYLYKAVPEDAIITSDRSSTVYMLRGPGYPANENANRIFDMFSGLGYVGPSVLIDEAARLAEEADREYRLREQNNEANSPTAQGLAEIARVAWTTYQDLEKRCKKPENISAFTVADLARELELTAALTALIQTKYNFSKTSDQLKDLQSDLYKENVWIPWKQRKEYLGSKYPLFIAIGDQPLPNDVWTYLIKAGSLWDSQNSKGKIKYIIDTNFLKFIQRALPLNLPDKAPERALRMSAYYGQLGKDLRDTCEYLLAIRSGLQNQWEYIPRLSWVDEEGTEWEQLRLEEDVSQKQAHDGTRTSNNLKSSDGNDVHKSAILKMQVVEAEPYRRAISDTQGLITSAISMIDRLIDAHSIELREVARHFIREKITIEALARHFDQLVPRHPNRKLSVVSDPDSPPTRLTVMMKTLFIKYLTEGSTSVPPQARGAELLVTCAVQNASDIAGDDGTVMPVVYEPHYAPGLFVNVRDRIVYGPKTYNGSFFNIELSVVELDGLANSAISKGLDLAIDVLGKAQPELAAISPFVSTFFKGVLNSLTEDDIELKFQFTIPGPEGKGKADVDFLIAETGHYIILKKENETRDEYNTKASVNRYTNRDLIYNPEDGLLYHRVDMENPKNNFIPKNIFRDQTYAVLVVTDEYAEEDNLGEALRKRLSKQLGEDRSSDLIPTVAQANTLLDNYQSFSSALVLADGAKLDQDTQRQRHLTVKDQQKKLWSSSSDLTKTFIVRGLYDLADEETQSALGQSIDAWKRANLVVGDDGRVRAE